LPASVLTQTVRKEGWGVTTLKTMVQKDLTVPLKPIPIEAFREGLRQIDFDLFLELSPENYAHVFSKESGIDYQRLAQYRAKGVTHLHIRESEFESFTLYQKRLTQTVLDNPSASNEDRIGAIMNMTEQNLSELYAQLKVDPETFKSTKKVIQNYVKFMTQDPNQMSMLLKLISLGDYYYYHSVATSVIAMFIAKRLNQFNSKMLEILGLGGFLHDIGMSRIPKSVLNNPGKLSKEDWELIKRHPALGLEMISNTPGISDEVCYIVYQHHEQPSGKGYPNGLKGAVIYFPAKIVGLASTFTALITQRPFRPEFTISEALQLIDSEKGKHDSKLFETLKATLAQQSAKKIA